MGKNKLKKFREMETLACVVQCPFGALEQAGEFALRGRWARDFFHNDRPIVLELGCGKGEYAVGLGERFEDKNFIGIDIKGARMWTGACRVRDKGLKNVGFLRTSIELLERFFAPGEVSEIWITFADPQMKKTRKRLTATNFVALYRRILRPEGVVHLKTDSPFLYTYTRLMSEHSRLEVLTDTADLYGDASLDEATRSLLDIRTYYEEQWLSRGMTIKYFAFRPGAAGELVEPTEEIEPDSYRAYPRHTVMPHEETGRD